MNSNSQPTPGPWEVSKGGNLIATVNDPRVHIAQIVETGVCAPTPREAQSNARLIAAAPALLAACKAAADYLAKIPAFGDTIGSDVSKAQLGVALNQLRSAIALSQEGK